MKRMNSRGRRAPLGSRDDAFDRSWTIGSLLLMGLFALLFGSNFWVG